MLSKLKGWGHAEEPPAITTDGRGGCQDAMKELWGEENEDKWQYIQFIRQKIPGEGIRTKTKIIYGNASTIDYLGANLSYVDRTQLTSRQMNGRLVRKTLSFSKKGKFLEASCILDDWIYNLVKTVRTLRLKENEKWQYFSPAMKAHITDHLWTIEELLKTVVNPST